MYFVITPSTKRVRLVSQEVDGSSKPNDARSLGTLKDIFSKLFIPRGYISDEYITFQICDTVQATCSYLRSILTVHSTLKALGSVNEDASSIALAGTIAFILKDGSSMIGSLLFSSICTDFDTETKFWRLFADAMNDLALTIELIAIIIPYITTIDDKVYLSTLFLTTTSIANLCKSLCGVSASATRVSISTHFAKIISKHSKVNVQDIVGEIQAKEHAQETAVTLLGLFLGYLFTTMLNASLAVQIAAFIFLTILHMYANCLAVKTLSLNQLTRTRIAILMHQFAMREDILGPSRISSIEPYVPIQHSKRMVPSWMQIASRQGVHVSEEGLEARFGSDPSSILRPTSSSRIFIHTAIAQVHGKKNDNVKYSIKSRVKSKLDLPCLLELSSGDVWDGWVMSLAISWPRQASCFSCLQKKLPEIEAEVVYSADISGLAQLFAYFFIRELREALARVDSEEFETLNLEQFVEECASSNVALFFDFVNALQLAGWFESLTDMTVALGDERFRLVAASTHEE
jgi:Vitamin B6 photo-protection and homoeostasis